jgi:hypothetical protein
MRKLDSRIIDLPKRYYRVLNSPPPSRQWILATMAVIVITALIWAIV